VPKVIWDAGEKKLVYHSGYLTQQERLDDEELGLEPVGNRAIFAILHEIQPHRIALTSTVIREGRALFSSQYLGSTERPDPAHIIHEVRVRNPPGNMQGFKAQILCGAMTRFISLSILRKLELPHKPAFISTQGLNDQVMMSAKESRKGSLLVQYFEHLALVDESAVLVVPVKAYNLVLGLPWFVSFYSYCIHSN